MKHITKKGVSRTRKQARTRYRSRKHATITRKSKKSKSFMDVYTKKRKVMAGGVNPPPPSEMPGRFVRQSRNRLGYGRPDSPVEVFDVPTPSNMEDSRTVICKCDKSKTSE